MAAQRKIRLVLVADTHLGFDAPVRPRVKRRRRGPDFFANFQRVLDHAVARRVDMVVHGGDLFFRSRVPPPIVDRAYNMMCRFADQAIPILIVPGNHERSALPQSVFLSHPNIHVFTDPMTMRFEFERVTLAVSGFPFARRDVRARFRDLIDETGWSRTHGDVRLLCMHQTLEGARVGPAGYTFRRGHDVIRISEIPSVFDAVLAGHIHRRQILTAHPPDGGTIPILYPGSTERTSFAERAEPKGFYKIEIVARGGGERPAVSTTFLPLSARPMEELVLGGLTDPRQLERFVRARLKTFSPDAIVRFSAAPGVPHDVRTALTSEMLRKLVPPTMNVQISGGLFRWQRDTEEEARETA